MFFTPDLRKGRENETNTMKAVLSHWTVICDAAATAAAAAHDDDDDDDGCDGDDDD